MSDSPTATKLNVIIIMVDDLGFSDVGCYGGEISTPNIDALGTGGVRFTQMYNGARCCPSRAALLTGLHPHQAGIGQMTQDLDYPAYQGFLNQSSVTIGEVMGQSGYRTLMSGKWHVGGSYDARSRDEMSRRSRRNHSADFKAKGTPSTRPKSLPKWERGKGGVSCRHIRVGEGV